MRKDLEKVSQVNLWNTLKEQLEKITPNFLS
uniref:Ganglioside-induced differentiation-associated-protein 10 n=1 Tax=Mus musculus TaxID=10090 RepID=Q7TMV0_MOUSE|nr:Ganglioside-induced differentiation-associated-protein 10 [Mus musculus]